MNLKELTPGYYKIRKRDYQGKRKGNTSTIHLLRVAGAGERLLYFFDHDLIGFHPRNEDFLDYEVIAKLNGPPEVNKCEITISFVDTAGHSYNWSVKDAWALRALFVALPWLREPFGYLPNRSKIVK